MCLGEQAASLWGSPQGGGTPSLLTSLPPPLAEPVRSHFHPSQIPGRLMSNRQRGAGCARPRVGVPGCSCQPRLPRPGSVQGWGAGGREPSPQGWGLQQGQQWAGGRWKGKGLYGHFELYGLFEAPRAAVKTTWGSWGGLQSSAETPPTRVVLLAKAGLAVPDTPCSSLPQRPALSAAWTVPTSSWVPAKAPSAGSRLRSGAACRCWSPSPPPAPAPRRRRRKMRRKAAFGGCH